MRNLLTVALLSTSLATFEAASQRSLPTITNDRLVGGVTDYVIKKGDTLRSIAARYGVDIGTLGRENGLRTHHKLAQAQLLRIDHRHIVPATLGSVDLIVNIPQRMLFYRRTDGATVGYPVAVGRPDWPTPSGPFTVTVLERHPTWDVPPSILEESRKKGRIQPQTVPPGPDNPLGDYWIGLTLAGIGIHATNVPSSIFGTVSHGCIRVHPDDIARLFGDIHVGASGRIIYEPVLLTVSDDAVYLEVHRDVYRRAVAEPRAVARKLASDIGVSDLIDWTLTDAVVAAREGIARNVTRVPAAH
jgi:L,D-transpeptidase ErfK/SrfK